jgi:hypothetical protein
MDDHTPLPAAGEDALVGSKAQAECGESVPLEPFMARLTMTIDRLKASHDMEEATKVTPQA